MKCVNNLQNIDHKSWVYLSKSSIGEKIHIQKNEAFSIEQLETEGFYLMKWYYIIEP